MIEPRMFAREGAAESSPLGTMRSEPWTPALRTALMRANPQTAMLHVSSKRGGCVERAHTVRVLGDAGLGCVVVLVEGEAEPRRICAKRIT